VAISGSSQGAEIKQSYAPCEGEITVNSQRNPTYEPPSRVKSSYPNSPGKDALSVAQLLALAKNLLEESFLGLWVEGEVANFRPAASGHWYFTLKDPQAELKVAMFRGRNLYSAVSPVNGMRLRVRGRVTVFEARGELQMVAEQIEDAGAGAAARALELLKAKLSAEGLFDLERKRVLRKMPRRIALISSPTGAAVHDFLVVLARRFPLVSVELWPALVQGELAAEQLRAALLGVAAHAGRYDVVVITRGGGSAQDLAAFNDEALVRAVAHSPVPVVSAIGHEIDVSLCDFAADLRAATPTAAAELITPDGSVLRAQLEAHKTALRRFIGNALEPAGQRLDYARRLLDAHAPHARLQAMAQRLAAARHDLHRALQRAQESAQNRLTLAHKNLARQVPSGAIDTAVLTLQRARARLHSALQNTLTLSGHRLHLAQAALSTLSPKRTLERGYVLVRDQAGKKVLSSLQQLPRPGQIRLYFHDGELSAYTLAADTKDPANPANLVKSDDHG
jgi:exodeoxyribonuclease VII large subunit